MFVDRLVCPLLTPVRIGCRRRRDGLDNDLGGIARLLELLRSTLDGPRALVGSCGLRCSLSGSVWFCARATDRVVVCGARSISTDRAGALGCQGGVCNAPLEKNSGSHLVTISDLASTLLWGVSLWGVYPITPGCCRNCVTGPAPERNSGRGSTNCVLE